MENNSESNISVKIKSLWISINKIFYDYSRISSYSIIYEWENAVILRLNLNKKLLKYIDLKINNEIALNLKEILPNYLTADEDWELSFIDKIIKILKI